MNFAIFRQASVYAAASIFLKGTGFLVTLWLARTMDTETFGVWGLAFSLQTALSTFSLMGIVEATTAIFFKNESQLHRSLVHSAANLAFILVATISFLVLTTYILVNHVLAQWAITAILGVELCGILAGYSLLQSQLARFDDNHKKSLFYVFVPPFFGTIGGAALFMIGRTPQDFFYGTLAGFLVASIRISRRKHFPIARGWIAIKPLLRRTPPYILIAIFGWLSGYGNNFIIEHFFDSHAIAGFTFAMTIGSIIQLLASAMNQVWSPIFYRQTHHEEIASVEKKNRRFYTIEVYVMATASMAISFLIPLCADRVGGNLVHYGKMHTEFFLILSSYLLLVPYWHIQNYYMAYDQGRKIMNNTIVTSIIGVTVWVMLMATFGQIGIYAGFFVQMALRTAGIYLQSRRYWQLAIPWRHVVISMAMLTSATLIQSRLF